MVHNVVQGASQPDLQSAAGEWGQARAARAGHLSSFSATPRGRVQSPGPGNGQSTEGRLQ